MSAVEISITATDGSFMGYLARPGLEGTGPGVIVLQEIFGVNTVMRGVCDWLASQGFVALCPDLFWRIAPRTVLTDNSDAEWARAFELYKAFDVDRGMEDVQAAISTLRGQSAVAGKVGAIGYCLGGALAYLAATRTDSDASVGFYGVGIENRLGEADRIKKPLMLHIAERDAYCTPDAQAKVRERMASVSMATIHSYPGLDHAFARAGGAHYDDAGAKAANDRTLAFLRLHLA